MIRIPFGSLPSTTRLFLDYVRDWSSVRHFYPHDFSLDSIAEFARQKQPLERAHRERLCTALAEQQKQWGSEAASSVDKLGSGAVVVIGGQQPGLFSGPNYTILKALTIIKIARALDERGIPAVPVFWIAAEDHDYEEIHWASILDRDSGLLKVRVDLSDGDASPVGWLQLRDDVSQAASDCLNRLPQSEFQPEVRKVLESSYQPGISPVDAFARMMSRLFGSSGLILANPLHPELKRLAEPIVAQAARKNSEIRSAVIARSRALSEAGYHEQVKVDNTFTGLFAYRGKSRQALRPEELGTDAPLSPNVLLRPVVQDVLFGTVAYVGGPAEIAYLGQAAAVYETLGRSLPPVFPRISATILEARISRVLKKYEMTFTDAFRGKEFMKRKAVESVQGVEMFDTARQRIENELESLRASLRAVDPTLDAALDTSRQKVMHQVETLRTKFVNAEARRNETLERQLDAISNSIYPEKKLQERVINVTSFLVRYGLGFVERLQAAVTLDPREHQVIDI